LGSKVRRRVGAGWRSLRVSLRSWDRCGSGSGSWSSA